MDDINPPPTQVPPTQPPVDPHKPNLDMYFDPIPEPEEVGRGNDRKEGFRGVVTTIVILLAAPLVAFFITSFVFQSYEVFGPSMQNTLHSGDRLIVVKANKSIARLTGKHYIPKRGEIIIFSRPEVLLSGGDTSRQLIKRVVALPGERVVVADGEVTVYNKENPNGFKPDNTGGYDDIALLTDSLGSKVDLTIQEGEVFVMGDNRDNSLDSRSFGPVNSDDIVGRAVYRFLPISAMNRF